jgi:hypothetical protein
MGRARWRHRGWVCCVLAFRGRRRALMQPRAWTELFFLDEAVALAAGHRPCAECHRADYRRFAAAWADAGLPGRRAPEIDAVLHAARVAGPARLAVHRADAARLPDGAFLRMDGRAMLVRGDSLLPWSPAGYGAGLPRPVGPAEVLTPAPTVAVLAAGYLPAIHPSADRGDVA